MSSKKHKTLKRPRRQILDEFHVALFDGRNDWSPDFCDDIHRLEVTILGGMGEFDEAVQLACSTGQKSRDEPRGCWRCFAFDSGVYVGGSYMLGMVIS